MPDHNLEIWIKISSLALTGLGALMLLMMKWIRDDMKDMKKDMKELKQTLEQQGNRLTAIETGLKMFEWFQVKTEKKIGG